MKLFTIGGVYFYGSVHIDRAAETVTGSLDIKAELLIGYINDYKELFKIRIKNALENDSLAVVEHEEENEVTFAFDEGKRMSEKEFKLTAGKLTRLTNKSYKVSLINSSIHSLQDFIDILNADCLFGEEFESVFAALEDIELTILAKIVFYEELKDGNTSLQDLMYSKKETEDEWQEHFIEFPLSLDKPKQNRIEELLSQIDY